MYPIVRRTDSGIEGSGGVVEGFRAGGAKNVLPMRKQLPVKQPTIYAWKSSAPQLDKGKSPAPPFSMA